MAKKKTTFDFLKDIRTMLGIGGLLLLAVLVMSAIDSRKGARITGLAVTINPLEGTSYMIQSVSKLLKTYWKESLSLQMQMYL